MPTCMTGLPGATHGMKEAHSDQMTERKGGRITKHWDMNKGLSNPGRTELFCFT